MGRTRAVSACCVLGTYYMKHMTQKPKGKVPQPDMELYMYMMINLSVQYVHILYVPCVQFQEASATPWCQHS